MRSIFLRAVLLGAMLSFVGSVWAQESAKQDMKDAGHDTKSAAKHTGKAVKKTAKKVTHKSAHKVRKGSQEIEDKTTPQP